MNIIEEQNMNGETNPDVTGNIETHPVPPSAKKVYSKPTLVILSTIASHGKISPLQNEILSQGAGS
jgi:hypothetical protein